MKGFCFTLMKKNPSSFSSFILAPGNLGGLILKAVGSIWCVVCLLNSEQLQLQLLLLRGVVFFLRENRERVCPFIISKKDVQNVDYLS